VASPGRSAPRSAHRDALSVERTLVAVALAVGLTAGWLSPHGLVLPLLALGIGVLLSTALRRERRPTSSLSALPVGMALFIDVLLLPSGLVALLLAFGAGAVVLLWVGLPEFEPPPTELSEVSREFAIPLVGGAVALGAAAIPLLNIVHASAIVVGVFAGLALLIVYLAELLPQPVLKAAGADASAVDGLE
jgi:hypothetical protein